MAYRDDLIALSARHDALAGEVEQKTRELEDTRQMLEQARARARLPVLDHLRVASPCTADWNQMTGDDRTRHCGQCQKDVYNVSGMTRDEAEALLIERSGELCVRYYLRHDGTVLLADCSVGVKHRTRRRRIAAGAAALLVGGIGAAALHRPSAVLGSIERMPPEPPTGFHVTMGKVDRALPPPGTSPDDSRDAIDDGDAPIAPPTMQLPLDDAQSPAARTSQPGKGAPGRWR